MMYHRHEPSISSRQPAAAEPRRRPRVPARVSAPVPIAVDRFLLQYINGWARADVAEIAGAVTADYRFLDPLVGQFDAASLGDYFAILRRRVGFGGLRDQRGQVRLDPFPPAAWPLRQLLFWRSIPECGLSGTSDIETRAARVCREAVCYEPNMASEQLRRRT